MTCVYKYRALLHNRNFLVLWLGGAISNIGDFFNAVALVKILSSDPAHFGLLWALVLVAKMVPGFLLGPIAGVVADRLPRRMIMVTSDLLRAGLVFGLVLTNNPIAIVTLVFLAAAVSAFHNPASSALLPNLVSGDELVTAGALSLMTSRTAQLIGNGLGALALASLGAHNVFYIDAASFVISALFTLSLRLETAGQALPESVRSPVAEGTTSVGARFKRDLAEALAFLRSSPPVRHLITTFGIATVGDSAMNVLMVTFFSVTLGIAIEHLGYVWAVFGGTSVLGALAIGALGSRVHWRHFVSFGGVYIWVMVMGALLSHHALTGATFMALVGLGSGGINVGANAAVGLLVPDHVRGRVFSAFGMVQSLINIAGTLVAGALSDHLGPAPVLMAFCTAYLATGLYAFFAFRDMRPTPAAA